MQSAHGTGEPELDALNSTKWNHKAQRVELPYIKGFYPFLRKMFPVSAILQKGLQVTQKQYKKLAYHVTRFCIC